MGLSPLVPSGDLLQLCFLLLLSCHAQVRNSCFASLLLLCLDVASSLYLQLYVLWPSRLQVILQVVLQFGCDVNVVMGGGELGFHRAHHLDWKLVISVLNVLHDERILSESLWRCLQCLNGIWEKLFGVLK